MAAVQCLSSSYVEERNSLDILDTSISLWPFSSKEAGTYRIYREKRQGKMQRMKELHRLRGVEKKIPKPRLLVRHNLGSKAFLKK